MSARKTLVRTALALTLGLGFVMGIESQQSAQAERAFSTIKASLTKTRTTVRGVVNDVASLAAIKNKRFVFLDLKVYLDGNEKGAVLSSTEEANRRYDIDCRPGSYGQLTMAQGIEYYVQVPYQGKMLKLSIYPGSRIKHTFNDVSCTYDPKHPNFAVFRIRGFYAVVTNEFPDGTLIQLRPVVPTEKEAAKVMR